VWQGYDQGRCADWQIPVVDAWVSLPAQRIFLATNLLEVRSMSRSRFVLSIVVLIGVALVVCGGCDKRQSERAPAATAAGGGDAPKSPSDAAGAQPVPAANPEIEQALAALSTEDRDLAARQRVCPVSEKPLGSMGTPVKVRVRDRDVLLCCEGCEEELRAKPEKYLAKLPK
jgi:hypothetical protein